MCMVVVLPPDIRLTKEDLFIVPAHPVSVNRVIHASWMLKFPVGKVRMFPFPTVNAVVNVP